MDFKKSQCVSQYGSKSGMYVEGYFCEMSNTCYIFLMRMVDMWCVRHWRRHGRMRLSNHNNKQPAFCAGRSLNHSVWFRNEQIVLVSTELASFEVLFSALSTRELNSVLWLYQAHIHTNTNTYTRASASTQKWIETLTWKAFSSICSTG